MRAPRWESLSLGAGPTKEALAKMGSPGYYARALDEIREFQRQIIREQGDQPYGAELRIRAHTSKEGGHRYVELCVVWRPEIEKADEWALRVESKLPERWDKTARQRLAEMGYLE